MSVFDRLKTEVALKVCDAVSSGIATNMYVPANKQVSHTIEDGYQKAVAGKVHIGIVPFMRVAVRVRVRSLVYAAYKN